MKRTLLNTNDWLLSPAEIATVRREAPATWMALNKDCSLESYIQECIINAQHRKTLEKISEWAKVPCPHPARDIHGVLVAYNRGACGKCWRELMEGLE